MKKNYLSFISLCISLWFCLCVFNASAAPPSELPLLYLSDIRYLGAFRLPEATFGTSSMNYSQGPLEYNPSHHSIFIVGHAHHQNIAEFAVPRIVNSTVLGDLEMAIAPLQVFTSVLDRATAGNPQSLDQIGGMAYVNIGSTPQLAVNAYEYYDAPGDNTQTTLIARNSDALSTCTISGYHTFEGGAGHTSGWISPIPGIWQSQLGGTHITGQSSGIPIISRTSVGPSSFAFSMGDLTGPGAVPNSVPTRKLLDFSLDHPLHEDLSNDTRANDLWTHLSRVVYGFIVPGTRTYLTIGYSGGHRSGVCYKCVQSDGNLCGGYCANDATDYDTYYWLWDVNDLAAVKNGAKNSYDLRPYAHGAFPTPLATREIGGGSFDPIGNTLYLTLQRADPEQGTYSNPPVVAAFGFDVENESQKSIVPSNFLLLK
jgi:hypothetical protein